MHARPVQACPSSDLQEAALIDGSAHVHCRRIRSDKISPRTSASRERLASRLREWPGLAGGVGQDTGKSVEQHVCFSRWRGERRCALYPKHTRLPDKRALSALFHHSVLVAVSSKDLGMSTSAFKARDRQPRDLDRVVVMHTL
jgi:hypothetical protein